jgi:ATP/ADP translocase
MKMAGVFASVWGMVVEVVLFWQKVCNIMETINVEY